MTILTALGIHRRKQLYIRIMQSLFQLIISTVALLVCAALQTAVQTQPRRSSSREAAELIQNRTATDDDGSLLVITCDASGRGGGSKHDGVASVLRIRHGVELLHRHQLTLSFTAADAAATTNNVDVYSQQSLTTSGGHKEKEDLIQVISRRTMPSRTSSEVAAIALGIKHAINTVPLSLRNKVLILSDSEFALNFYCGEKSYENRLPATTTRRRSGSSNKSKRRGKRQPTTRSTELREESYWRLFVTLLNETAPGGVFLSKIKSSSRSHSLNIDRSSSDIQNAELDSDNTSWDGRGFLDHDASDFLSSRARYIPNSSDDEDDSPFRAVSRLTSDDLTWLAYSDKLGPNDATLQNNDIWNEIIVKGSDARDNRRKRKELRIQSIQELLEGQKL